MSIFLQFVVIWAIAGCVLWLATRKPRKERTHGYTADRQGAEIERSLVRLAARASAERGPAAPGMAHEAVEPSRVVAFDVQDHGLAYPVKRR